MDKQIISFEFEWWIIKIKSWNGVCLLFNEFVKLNVFITTEKVIIAPQLMQYSVEAIEFLDKSKHISEHYRQEIIQINFINLKVYNFYY